MSQVLLVVICLDIVRLITGENSASAFVPRQFSFLVEEQKVK